MQWVESTSLTIREKRVAAEHRRRPERQRESAERLLGRDEEREVEDANVVFHRDKACRDGRPVGHQGSEAETDEDGRGTERRGRKYPPTGPGRAQPPTPVYDVISGGWVIVLRPPGEARWTCSAMISSWSAEAWPGYEPLFRRPKQGAV